MSAREDWDRLATRIRSVLRAVELLSRAPGRERNFSSRDACALVEAIKDYRTAHLREVPSNLLNELNLAVAELAEPAQKIGGSEGFVWQFVARLSIFESVASHLIHDTQETIKLSALRAFDHLQRIIAVEPFLRDRWQRALGRGTEPECEKLGAVFLLWHGIYSFKCHAAGQRTDLVFPQRTIDDVSTAFSPKGIILTEWKRFTEGDPEAKFKEARDQSKDYTRGVLGTTELTEYKFAIVVSEKNIAVPEPLPFEGGRWIHINICVNPDTPSKAARNRKRPLVSK